MDNSSDTVLAKKVALHLEIICRFDLSGRHLYLLRNTKTPSDAESCVEQDGSKHKFVGGMTAKLWLDLHKGVVINTENERFKPC